MASGSRGSGRSRGTGSARGSGNSPGSRNSRRLVSIGLFLALGLVGAFVVSAVAGLWDDEPAATGLRVFERGVEDRSEIRVEVLNGAGRSGLARSATHQLRGDGFDVVFFGNAGRFDHARSVSIDRMGSAEAARAVAAALGIDSVTTAIDSSLMLEVTVVLGRDWPPATPPERGWGERIRKLLERDSARDSTTATPGTPGARRTDAAAGGAGADEDHGVASGGG